MTHLHSSSNLSADLSDLILFFQTARDDLHKDLMVDMTGMEKEISGLCGRVQEANATVQKECLPKLTTLIDLLNEYEKDLRQYQALQTAKGSNDNA